jgi:prefoldin subunit 5
MKPSQQEIDDLKRTNQKLRDELVAYKQRVDLAERLIREARAASDTVKRILS